MRQSRHLGLFNMKDVPLNELVGLIALEVFQHCSIGYSQGGRSKFFSNSVSKADSRIKRLKQIKSKHPSGSCDCSSFVDSMWYLAHLIGKTKDKYQFSSGDSMNAIDAKHSTNDITFSNPYTTYNLHNICAYGFELKFGRSVKLEPGDIIVMHGQISREGYDGYLANVDPETGMGTVGHAQLYIGPGKYNGTNYESLMIECGGTKGDVANKGGLNLHTFGTTIEALGGMGTTTGTYVIRKIIKKTSGGSSSTPSSTPIFTNINYNKSLDRSMIRSTSIYKNPAINGGNWNTGITSGIDNFVVGLAYKGENTSSLDQFQMGIPFKLEMNSIDNFYSFNSINFNLTEIFLNNAYVDVDGTTFKYFISTINMTKDANKTNYLDERYAGNINEGISYVGSFDLQGGTQSITLALDNNQVEIYPNVQYYLYLYSDGYNTTRARNYHYDGGMTYTINYTKVTYS